MNITGRKLFVKALEAEHVDKLFAYPGGMINELTDELYKVSDKIETILGRHEQAVVHEAEGYAKATGRPGVALVTSGPGATNTITAIADAHYDSVPLVVFTGQVPQELIGNDAFQEVDIVGMTRSVVKYGVTVRDRKDLGRIIKMAFYIASTGRPGPVLVDIPKDIQKAEGESEYPESVDIRGYKPNTSVHIGQLKKAYKLLKSAKKPLILAGGGVRISRAESLLTELSHRMNIPVVTTVMGRGAIDTDDPMFVGDLGLHGSYASNMAVSHCDVLFSVGTRFNDRITGDLNEFAPHAKIIHVDIDTSSISRNVVVDVPITADAGLTFQKLLEWAEPSINKKWLDEIESWKKDHPMEMPKKGMTPQKIINAIDKVYPKGYIVTDVGQHQMWTTQFAHLGPERHLITSGGLGTMGFGIMIFNNQYLGMVRQQQQLFYGKRYSITCLRKNRSCPPDCKGPHGTCPPYEPDFIKWGESYGVRGIRVTQESEIEEALNESKKVLDRPFIIEFAVSSDELVLPMVKPGGAEDDMILP